MMSDNESLRKQLGRPCIWPFAVALGAILLYYLALPVNPTYSRPTIAGWAMSAWNGETEYEHAWAIPFLFIILLGLAWKSMIDRPVKSSLWGWLIVGFGLILYIASVRILQPRVALIALPFLITGGVLATCGWQITKPVIFPAFIWWFAIPVPGLQQATNVLQLFVTNTCYSVGSALGMQLVRTGNTITSATGQWNSLDIAEGCSGIRSLMALFLIAALYSYFTQTKLWKMAVLFACALPLAVVANFLRIFTIIILAEMGFSDFAAGAYHDWAGLLFFFPIALAGLFMIDKLLNWKNNRKVVRKRLQ